MDEHSLHAAQGDAQAALGRACAPYGGGDLELPGVRLMSSGIAVPQWNTGDVDDPSLVDLDRVRAWFAERGVPWGVRVPVGLPWTAGRHVVRQRVMGLDSADLQDTAPVRGLQLRPAGPQDVGDVVAVDVAAFHGDVALSGEWWRRLVGAETLRVVLARLDGRVAGAAYAVLADGRAGRSVGLYGVGVVPDARRRGVASAMSRWLLEAAFQDGAVLAHLNPDTDDAARVYARLGFVESDGFDIYVDL